MLVVTPVGLEAALADPLGQAVGEQVLAVAAQADPGVGVDQIPEQAEILVREPGQGVPGAPVPAL
ncbi:MAG: hypothetical protein MI923_24890 [Phycisphaerales bacterium]|nr:hypothetical protein [Phycisphaerales bacterium]